MAMPLRSWNSARWSSLARKIGSCTALCSLLAVLFTGLTSYALRRGLVRRAVVAGLLSFGVGIGALFAAGLIDGFVLPEIAIRFAVASPAVQAAAITTLGACGVAVNVATAFGVVALAAGIAAWSLDLAREAGASRLAGIVGFVVASLSVAMPFTGDPSRLPHVLMAVFCVQGGWFGWISVLLARDRA